LVYFTHFGMLYQEKSGKPGKLHPMRWGRDKFPSCTSETKKVGQF
jgi:hypothetical protein